MYRAGALLLRPTGAARRLYRKGALLPHKKRALLLHREEEATGCSRRLYREGGLLLPTGRIRRLYREGVMPTPGRGTSPPAQGASADCALLSSLSSKRGRLGNRRRLRSSLLQLIRRVCWRRRNLPGRCVRGLGKRRGVKRRLLRLTRRV